MFSVDTFEFESIANRHSIFDYQPPSETDLFLCNDSSDSDLYSIYNSDQENNIDKMWVLSDKVAENNVPLNHHDLWFWYLTPRRIGLSSVDCLKKVDQN